jgi:hypothetical protein
MAAGSLVAVGMSCGRASEETFAVTAAAVTTAAPVALGAQAGAVSEGSASRAPPQPVRHL